MSSYFGVLYVGIFVLMIASVWKIFEKAGFPGWASLIPIYNIIVLLRLVGKPLWYIVLFLIPLVNVVVLVYLMYLLARSFDQDLLFAIGLIILPFIFYPILAFGDAPYLGPRSHPMDYFDDEEYEGEDQ
jgi:hypothetical protein